MMVSDDGEYDMMMMNMMVNMMVNMMGGCRRMKPDMLFSPINCNQ